MKLRTIMAAAAALTVLAACSKAPDEVPPAADAGASTSEAYGAGHATPAGPALGLVRTSAPAGARVFIISPQDGETVTSPVKVVFGIEGMALVPAGERNDTAGHHHLLVDTDLADPSIPIPADDKHIHFGKAQTDAEVPLPPGKHTLQLVLGDYLHIPFDPVIASGKITVTVN